MDHNKAFVKSRDIATDERIGSINRRNTLEVNVSVGELRRDVIYIVRHPTQNRINDRLSTITTLSIITMNFFESIPNLQLEPHQLVNQHAALRQYLWQQYHHAVLHKRA